LHSFLFFAFFYFLFSGMNNQRFKINSHIKHAR
jgi:hypothetical protein